MSSAKHQSVLFVGTKKQAKAVLRELAEACGEFYVCERWLGGMLTNLTTLRQSVKKLERIEKRIAAGGDGLTKKELSLLGKDQDKLDRNLSGVRGMRKTPGLLIVVDPPENTLLLKKRASWAFQSWRSSIQTAIQIQSTMSLLATMMHSRVLN